MSHCGQGMVFAVNAGPDGSNESFAAFKAAALNVGAQFASSAMNAKTSQPSKSIGSVSGGLSTATSTSTLSHAQAQTMARIGLPSWNVNRLNGAISLNVDATMLMAAFGMVVSLIA